MFLHLGHTKLEVFSISRKFVLHCYKETKLYPNDERYALTQQIRRAALSVHLNLAEGSSRASLNERKRFFEISRGSLIEVDAAFDIAQNLGYTTQDKLIDIGESIVTIFKMLSKMINQTNAG
ncbi:MAG: four helix bundle protein [Chitinophagaceae bacterium]